jgi:EAL domain-containing protein (putative c-di-GMP-specific phosphodiesterase class I)/ActR/RegA family two-component response regulator
MSNLANNGHQVVLILDDDVMITGGLAAGLARAGRTVVTCNDIEGGEVVIDWLQPSHVVSDVHLTGAFGYEGLDFVRFVKRRSPETRIILMTGDAPDALQLEASERGAVSFLQKPFEVSEIDAVLDFLAPDRAGSTAWPEIIDVPALERILSEQLLWTAFQPVVKLPSGEPLGYEALARCRTDSPLRNPETLFKYAIRKHRLVDLELACIRNSIQSGAVLPGSLFLNLHPSIFGSARQLFDALEDEARRCHVDLGRIVLEVTEQSAITNELKALDVIQRLKSLGVRFAFDDLGVAYSHLPFIGRVRPAFLKISQHFGTGFESDPTKTKIVRNILELATEFDAELILEGIETEATARAAAELGITYGQGYYFARPAPADTFADPS